MRSRLRNVISCKNSLPSSGTDTLPIDTDGPEACIPQPRWGQETRRWWHTWLVSGFSFHHARSPICRDLTR